MDTDTNNIMKPNIRDPYSPLLSGPCYIRNDDTGLVNSGSFSFSCDGCIRNEALQLQLQIGCKIKAAIIMMNLSFVSFHFQDVLA